MARRPLVGITCDIAGSPHGERAFSYRSYARAVCEAGGVPLALPHDPALVPDLLAALDAFVLTGGDDPRTEPFGAPTHPAATPLHPDRQRFESALIEAIRAAPGGGPPTLGICLGMQMMALHAGGELDQHMPDTRADADRHWNAEHAIMPTPAGSALRGRDGPIIGERAVFSRHRQAVAHPGTLSVAALSDDGVIEAVFDPARRFHVGVQWHPERTAGSGLFRALVRECAGA